ncbi:GNAT family N-acetyltransferase [Halorussus pelagicus]|uniref:GNAT family N-acetyltransferase n=1 Tax=Halorussus pelagicus TaxID=2505977 RepID=UPI000FFB6128|nr:GNAT family N-acetyltransferase [Halorussus pelagicus]
MATPQLEFESDVASRIYRYVERHGAADPEEVREQVRVSESAESKPARSGTEPSVRLPVGEFNAHVERLTDEGHLTERDGKLAVEPDAETERHETDDFAYEIRPARESDRETVARLIRAVAAEGAIVVDERVADAIERDDALIRRNERESRMVFVAEKLGDETEREDGENGNKADEVDREIVGWVYLQGFELPARDHTAELTVGVAPEYRERGIGGTLLERGMAWADAEDCRKVYQSLPATNDEALELLEEHGWSREATRADHYKIEGELVDEVQMAERLDGE